MGKEELLARIRELMRQQGISQARLAKLSGRSPSTIQKLLSGGIEHPKSDLVAQVAAALDVDPWDLLEKERGFMRPQLTFGQRSKKYEDYDSGLVGDVTYGDGFIVSTNQVFEKAWRIQNLGKEPWVDFRLVNMDDPSTRMYLRPAQRELSLPIVEPRKAITIRVILKAPPWPGTVRSYWKMVDSDGELVFPDKEGIWCEVRVLDA